MEFSGGRDASLVVFRYNAGEWELTFSYPDFSMQDARSNAISPLGGPSIGLIGTVCDGVGIAG